MRGFKGKHIFGGRDECDKNALPMSERCLLLALCVLLVFPFGLLTPSVHASGVSETPVFSVVSGEEPEDFEPLLNADKGLPPDSTVNLDAELVLPMPENVNDSLPPTEVRANDYPYGLDGKKIFNPSPTRAVWLAALFPGLGQIYNRRYWKLPIVVGGFMGLAYATNWNNGQYQDYVQGYRDLTDSDPGTNSYMDFFPPTVDESQLDKSWLTRTFRSKRDYFRRNRDLCIICVVGLYLLCIVDAYIDASMAHFDISPNLSIDWSPAVMMQRNTGKPAFGLNWALNF